MTQDEESIAHAKELIQAVLNGEQLTKDENGVAQVVSGGSDDDESSEE